MSKSENSNINVCDNELIIKASDALSLIPQFSGDSRLLNLYIRKCEYAILKYQGDQNRNEYLMQCFTSKLTGNAAALISERNDITTWNELKNLLDQHFGDPRSEECVAIELESLKLKNNESFSDFCHRIQSVRSILLAKVNRLANSSLREAKHIIYNNTCLNVFLYNLPENMIRMVRIKNPTTLEEAHKYVLEEINFQEQYNRRNRFFDNKPKIPAQPTMQQKFNFPFTAQPPMAKNIPFQASGFPQNPQFKFGIPQNNNQFRFGIPPGMGRPMQSSGFMAQPGGYRPQQQFGYHPPQQFGYRPPQFGNSLPQQQLNNTRPFDKKPIPSNDVSMRTAPAKPQFYLNEPYVEDYNNCIYPNKLPYYYEQDDMTPETDYEEPYFEQYPVSQIDNLLVDSVNNIDLDIGAPAQNRDNSENFQVKASEFPQK